MTSRTATSSSVVEARAVSSKDGTSGWIRRGLLFTAGSVLLGVYLYGLDYSALLEFTRSFPIALAAGVVLLNLCPGIVKYLRWRHFLGHRGFGVEGLRGYLAVNASFFLGLVTPGTVGELSRAWVGESEEPGRATAVVAFEKLTDLVILVLLVVGSAAVQFTEGARSWAVVGLAGVAVAGVYVLFLRYDALLTGPLDFFLQRLLSDERRDSLRDVYWEFYEILGDRRLVLVSAAASTALWLVTLAQMHMIFTGLGWDLPLKTTALALFLPYLLGVISLIPLGLGVFELVMSRITEIGVLASVAGGTAVGPLFFRFLVTVPLILGGYACHLALTLRPRNRSR